MSDERPCWHLTFDTAGDLEHLLVGQIAERGGLLWGVRALNQIWGIAEIPNRADDPKVAYEIDASDIAGALAKIERLGWECLGSFHSHPGAGAQMSPDDARTALMTGLLLVIGYSCIDSAPSWSWALYDPAEGGEVQLQVALPRSLPFPSQ